MDPSGRATRLQPQVLEPAASDVADSAAALPSAGMAHGLLFLPVLLSLVGPGEIDVGTPAVPEAKPKDGVAMGSVDSSMVNEA